MDDRKYLALDELVVWSDNPRHGLQARQKDISEIDAINILIDVVGADKMYNLIADIFNMKKLLGNVNPVVVQEGACYYVYDGNRRVSALKILKNPSIIEDDVLQSRVRKLIDGQDVSFANRVFVYITDEAEALEIMDKTHSGEQQGVGMISWEPYQRDTSLNRRGKALQYPYAFSVCSTLDYTMKSFGDISYTDIDRLFGSKPLREFFQIDETSEDYSDKIEYVISMLITYKHVKNFRSFSREFNTSGSTAEDSAIMSFCNWVTEQEKSQRKYTFKTTPVTIFTDEPFSFDFLQLCITDRKKQQVSFKMEDLEIKYTSPSGNTASDISVSDIGNWSVEIAYGGEAHTETIEVKKLLSPKIDFDTRVLFGQGNTVDLRQLVIRATDGHGKDRKKDLQITANGAKIVKDIFAQDNPIGIYQIAYSFTDITDAPFSVTKEIRIIDKSNPLLTENCATPLLSFNGSVQTINISEVVNKLVREINALDLNNSICVISTALRTLVELSFDELHARGKLCFSNKSNLESCISEFKVVLLNGKLSELCRLYDKELSSFHSEKNCVEQINPADLASYLNLATHKSIARIDITKIAEIARKNIAPILVYASLMLR